MTAFGDEIQMVEHVEWQIGIGRIDTSLDKHVDAILPAHFNVGKFFAGTAVDIQIEFRSFGRACEKYALDAKLFFVAVVDHKPFRGSRLAREYGVEAKRVGRKFELVAAAGGKSVFDAGCRRQ